MERLPREHERLGDEIATLSAHLDAATHRFLTLIRRFDACGGFAAQGALTCAHWLSWRVGLELGAAREHVRVAHTLGDLPHIDGALRAGQVSYSKVRAPTRVATPATEASLLDVARSATASQLERICRGFQRALRDGTNDRPEDEADRRWVGERDTESGFVRFDIQVGPEEAAILRRALEVAATRTWSDGLSAGTRAAVLRRADALVAVAESYLAATPAAEGPPVELVVHVEPQGGTLDDGTALQEATVDRLACDATVVAVVEDFTGNVLDVGRRRRTIPRLLRRALQLREKGCRFPGCTNRRVDGHHVVPWSRGGPTTLASLCCLCRRHHTFVKVTCTGPDSRPPSDHSSSPAGSCRSARSGRLLDKYPNPRVRDGSSAWTRSWCGGWASSSCARSSSSHFSLSPSSSTSSCDGRRPSLDSLTTAG